MNTVKCKIDDRGCVYHACMSDNCQKNVVLMAGVDWGKGNCDKKTRKSIHERGIRYRKEGFSILKAVSRRDNYC